MAFSIPREYRTLAVTANTVWYNGSAKCHRRRTVGSGPRLAGHVPEPTLTSNYALTLIACKLLSFATTVTTASVTTFIASVTALVSSTFLSIQRAGDSQKILGSLETLRWKNKVEGKRQSEEGGTRSTFMKQEGKEEEEGEDDDDDDEEEEEEEEEEMR
ncbi:hypothetical protein V1478_013368 [Vespula squamosa]|uniref:Uncharacterized protein n=1 Tax=Vespula squamosa TaxID=30214 RepID=A0ABD2AAM5_VESSQ